MRLSDGPANVRMRAISQQTRGNSRYRRGRRSRRDCGLRGHSHGGCGGRVGLLHGRGHVGFLALRFRCDWESMLARVDKYAGEFYLHFGTIVVNVVVTVQTEVRT